MFFVAVLVTAYLLYHSFKCLSTTFLKTFSNVRYALEAFLIILNKFCFCVSRTCIRIPEYLHFVNSFFILFKATFWGSPVIEFLFLVSRIIDGIIIRQPEWPE